MIRGEFGFTNEQYGLVTFAFLATYAAGQLLLGPVIDRLGGKRSLSLAVFWWSVASRSPTSASVLVTRRLMWRLPVIAG